MYAPSSYNDTVTGETLSSVSEKSDSYSNDGSQPDYMVRIPPSPPFTRIKAFPNIHFSPTLVKTQDETRKKAASTYLVENSDMPPPRYQKDGTLPHYPNNINAGECPGSRRFRAKISTSVIMRTKPLSFSQLTREPFRTRDTTTSCTSSEAATTSCWGSRTTTSRRRPRARRWMGLITI